MPGPYAEIQRILIPSVDIKGSPEINKFEINEEFVLNLCYIGNILEHDSNKVFLKFSNLRDHGL